MTERARQARASEVRVTGRVGARERPSWLSCQQTASKADTSRWSCGTCARPRQRPGSPHHARTSQSLPDRWRVGPTVHATQGANLPPRCDRPVGGKPELLSVHQMNALGSRRMTWLDGEIPNSWLAARL